MMTKKEVIWREILYESRAHKKIQFTQKELAQKFGFSLSTVFNALKTPRASHIIRVTGRFFVLEDYRKLLYLWASERNMKKDIYYTAYVPKDVHELEGVMPPSAAFGAYSAYWALYGKTPADYDHLYVYCGKEHVKEIIERLSSLDGGKSKAAAPNIFVLAPDSWSTLYHEPLLEQIFVDIWNAPEWYAKDFLRELESDIA